MSYVFNQPTDEEIPLLAANATFAFALNDVAASEKWLRRAALSEHRVLRHTEDGPPIAAMLRVPDGMYFHGKVVSCLGISAVVVPPEHRRGGVAQTMMEYTLREARERGEAVSVLFPSTQALYRKVGYEAAGYLFLLRTRLGRWGKVDDALEVRPLEDGVPEVVRACYRSWAVEHNGMMERHDFLWSRVEYRRGMQYKGWGLFNSQNELEAYTYLHQRIEGDEVQLVASDLVYTTPRGARSLLAFLSSFGTISSEVVWMAGPSHPLFHLLDQQRFSAEFGDYWMLRVVDIEGAIRQRGWPLGARGVLALSVTDELFQENSGLWELDVAGGSAVLRRVTNTKAPVLHTNERALAAMYTGYLRPFAMARMGLLEGNREALSLAEELFLAPTPWLTDPF